MMPYDPENPASTTGSSWWPGLRPASGRITARLTPVVSTGATGARPRAHVTVANLRLDERDVHERATALAERVRVLSAGHSMRIWRDAHRDALVELTREASGVGTGVACETLSWDLDGAVYHVFATFSADQPAIH